MKRGLGPFLVLAVLAAFAVLALAGTASASSPSIVGTVVDASTGQPVAGICVTVMVVKTSPSGYEAETTTDASGDFSFVAPAGDYNVYLTSCGNDAYVSVVYDSSSSTHTSVFDPFEVATDVITVTADGGTQDLGTLRLQPGAASVSGVVENTSGDPLAGVCVNVAPLAMPQPPTGLPNFVGDGVGGPDGGTSADGSYTVNGLPPAAAMVRFAAGKCGVSGYFDGTYDAANPPTNTVGINAYFFFPVPPVSLVAGQTANLGVSELYPIEPPAATISSPSSGNVYAMNESVATPFGCAEAPGGPGLSSCVDSNGVSAPFVSSPPSNLAIGPTMAATGQLDTSNAGTFSYSVIATSFSGLTATTTTSYVVIGQQQCKHGGWQSFGIFKNQGDCVSYVASKGKNPPRGG